MNRTLGILLGFSAVVATRGPAQKADSTLTLADLEARAQRDSLDPEAHFRLAIRYWDLKRWYDVERELKTTIAIEPHYAPAYLSLAYMPYDMHPKLWDQERKKKVPQDLEKVLDDSYHLRRQAFLIDPMVDLRVVGSRAPDEQMLTLPDYGAMTTIMLWYIGLGAFGETRYELSWSALDKYLERAYGKDPRDSIPDYLFWYHGLAAAHVQLYAVAVADFETLLAREQSREKADTLIQIPLNTNDYRYVLAVLHQRWNKPADALQLYQEAITNDLGLYMAHFRLAQLYRDHGMWDQAVKEAQAAVDADPDDAELQVELGKIQAAAGHPDAAIETLQSAMAKNPRDPDIPYELGLVEQQANKPLDAKQHLTHFVTIAPSRLGTKVTDAKNRLATMP